MRYTRFIKKNDIDKLELEVISQELRVYLTRLLDSRIPYDESETQVRIILLNKIINRARNLRGLPLYILEADDWGNYHPAEDGWHISEFEILFRRLNVIQCIELICELIQWEYFGIDELNELFEKENLSFRIIEQSGNLDVVVIPIDEIEETSNGSEHPNIRVLIKRMDDALKSDDYSAVLHASASIFETMAKDIVGIATVQNQTLKSFFGRYRKDSGLPNEILNFIIGTYENRNSIPLAGHGSTQTPNILKKEAVVLREMTVAFVKIEYTLYTEVIKESEDHNAK
ncbi:hypothetical protein KAR34_08620 [bacterium]|nr:hypothetical protein [bacterium]